MFVMYKYGCFRNMYVVISSLSNNSLYGCVFAISVKLVTESVPQSELKESKS